MHNNHKTIGETKQKIFP